MGEAAKAKRMKDAQGGAVKKGGKAPLEIMVQRLSSEPDSRQVYRPMKPREFVKYEFEELSLNNIRKACASHYKMLASTCDVLISNKGPSCSNINQIRYRADKVFILY